MCYNIYVVKRESLILFVPSALLSFGPNRPKPANLLTTTKEFVLVVFGSAGDVDPSSTASSAATAFSSIPDGNRNCVGLFDDGVVAISPIYDAPETYV